MLNFGMRVLKLLGVPVFYTLYLQLPIGDRRRSGLLMPTVGHSSRDGYWYKQPIYWNIAPNYDATVHQNICHAVAGN